MKDASGFGDCFVVRVSVELRRSKQHSSMLHLAYHVRTLLLEDTHFPSSFVDHRGRMSKKTRDQGGGGSPRAGT